VAASCLLMPCSGCYPGPRVNRIGRPTAVSLDNGMPMAFLRKKRDADDAKKSVAIHVRNSAGLLGVPINRFTYSRLASPFFLRKKREAADQQADSALLYSNFA